MKIVNFGSLNIDYVYRVDDFLRPGETKPAKTRDIFCGGKGLNQSIACAKAGLETYHAGFIGSEGRFLADKLAACGVKTEYLHEISDSCGHAIIQVNDQGQNCILLYPGTNAALTGPFVDEVLSRFSEGDVVMLQNETNMVGEIIAKAAAKRMRVAFNAAPFSASIREYPLSQVTWLFVNELEGTALSGEADFDASAKKLRAACPHTEIIMTLGAEGSIYSGAEGHFRIPANKVTAVDTTAAGDTFTGYYLMGAVQGFGARRALEIAAAASAISVTRPGAADSIPARHELGL